MSFIFALLPYVIQLCLIIHCIKTGRSGWLWLLIFIPYIGGIAYIILNVIPDLKESRSLHNAGDAIGSKFNPNKEIQNLERLVKKQETITNIVALADAYENAGQFDKAMELYNQCLSGPYEHDSEIMFKVVKAYLHADKLAEAKEAMAQFKKYNSIQNAEQSLVELAVNEDYEKMAQIFTDSASFEVGYELAKHYKKEENFEEIQKIVNEMAEQRKDFPQLKKNRNAVLYRQTKALLK